MSAKHQWLDLQGEEPDPFETMRPRLSVWPDDDTEPSNVVLSVGSMNGAQQRYVELTPDEARTLALYLMEAATELEQKEKLQ